MMSGTDDGLFVYPPHLVLGSTEDRRFTEKYRIFGSTQTLRKNNSAKKLLEKVLALQTTLAEHIRVVLSDLELEYECVRYRELYAYIEKQWCQ